MEINIIKNKNILTVQLTGKLDQSKSDEIFKKIEKELTPEIEKVVVDLINCDFISSYGVFTIAELKKKVEGDGGNLELININDRIQKVFEMLNFLKE